MTENDPLVPLLAGLVVDTLWWLESRNEHEIDPDAAGQIMESVAWTLLNSPAELRQRFVNVLNDLAAVEEDPGRREVLEAFPFACGLIENEPPRPAQPWATWVHPALRTGRDS